MKAAPESNEVPYSTPVLDEAGKISRAWGKFFENAQSALDSLGVEKSFELVNNQASEADVENLTVDKNAVSQAAVDYLIQRVTTSTGATESVETGTFYLSYLPTSADWAIADGPTTAGVTLSVTSAGQVQYVTTNITGTASISKITWRARTLAAKHSSYSRMGR